MAVLLARRERDGLSLAAAVEGDGHPGRALSWWTRAVDRRLRRRERAGGGRCTLLVQPLVSVVVVADARGLAQVVLPLPVDPELIGAVAVAQGAVLDPGSPAGFALSAGLRVVVGD